MSILSATHFHNEQAAYEFVEARVWPKGRVCPHCGTVDQSGKLKGESTRIGTYKCYACRKPFTVKVGTIFEASHVKLHIWLQAIFLLCSSKKGISSNQLHRTLGVTLKTAWFLSHRIREAMRSDDLSPMGGSGGIVEVDETFIGHNGKKIVKSKKYGRNITHMNKVLSLVDRETGRARSVVVKDLKANTLYPIIRENVHREARLMTDDAPFYRKLGREFAQHGVVRHRMGEYVKRGDKEIHTQTIEGFFSIFKRGMKGIYQHCSKDHLHRYLAEYDFRYSNRVALGVEDEDRAERALRGIVGRRLTYRTTNRQMSGHG